MLQVRDQFILNHLIPKFSWIPLFRAKCETFLSIWALSVKCLYAGCTLFSGWCDSGNPVAHFNYSLSYGEGTFEYGDQHTMWVQRQTHPVPTDVGQEQISSSVLLMFRVVLRNKHWNAMRVHAREWNLDTLRPFSIYFCRCTLNLERGIGGNRNNFKRHFEGWGSCAWSS